MYSVYFSVSFYCAFFPPMYVIIIQELSQFLQHDRKCRLNLRLDTCVKCDSIFFFCENINFLSTSMDNRFSYITNIAHCSHPDNSPNNPALLFSGNLQQTFSERRNARDRPRELPTWGKKWLSRLTTYFSSHFVNNTMRSLLSRGTLYDVVHFHPNRKLSAEPPDSYWDFNSFFSPVNSPL